MLTLDFTKCGISIIIFHRRILFFKENIMKIQRWQKNTLENALETRRIVIISGARQAGKTTLAKRIVSKNAIYRTLDDSALLKVALDDPKGFLWHKEPTMIIDEIQKAPLLISEIKKIVDENNAKGQFVLTGSADIRAMPTVKESLAGRVKNLRLRTLTQGEIIGSSPSFLQRAFNGDFKSQYKNSSKKDLLDIALRGGYPEVISLSAKARKEWHKDYIEAIINKDMREIFNINRHETLNSLIKAMASWSSKYIGISGICSKFEVSKPTLMGYIQLFEVIYLCEKLPAWVKSDYDRIAKKNKFYFSDSGLMASLLNWTYKDASLDADKYGKLIETFVFGEIAAQAELNSEYSMYQYRDRENREIDFIIEHEDGSILAVEAKGGSNIGKNDFKHIKWFREHLAKDRKFMGIVLYSGEDTLPFGENMFAVPTAGLWE